jgi:hypothetical protein
MPLGKRRFAFFRARGSSAPMRGFLAAFVPTCGAGGFGFAECSPRAVSHVPEHESRRAQREFATESQEAGFSLFRLTSRVDGVGYSFA